MRVIPVEQKELCATSKSHQLNVEKLFGHERDFGSLEEADQQVQLAVSPQNTQREKQQVPTRAKMESFPFFLALSSLPLLTFLVLFFIETQTLSLELLSSFWLKTGTGNGKLTSLIASLLLVEFINYDIVT